MNLIAGILVVVIVAHFLLNRLADSLNLNAVSADIPTDFADSYAPDRYSESRKYLRATTRLGGVEETVGQVLFFGFWFLHGFSFLDQQVRALGLGPVWSGIIYIGGLVVASGLVGLPFSIYGTFVVEARFGFNRTTPGLFIMDRLKAIGLGLCLGAPLLAGVLAFFEYAGPLAWLWCWLGLSIVVIIMQIIVPAWIMPLFNRFVPIENEALTESVLSYARQNRFPLANVFVMDGSRRSTKSNAFFAGWGKQKRLVLFDTMLERHTVAEILTVVAHEVGHYRKKHLLIGMSLAIAQAGVMFYLLSLFISRPVFFDAFYVAQPSVYAGLIFFSVVYGPVDFFVGLAAQWLSRRHEYAADRFAVETTGDAASFINALKRLCADNLTNLNPHPFYVALNYSHPPMVQRIQAIRRLGDGAT